MRETLAVYCVTLCVEGIVKLQIFFLSSQSKLKKNKINVKKQKQNKNAKEKKTVGDNAGRQAGIEVRPLIIGHLNNGVK